jgi:hypothetical protein
MKRRAVRLLALLWLGWYLSGPLAATIDFWDSPQEEAKDIARDAGGTITLIAAAVSIAIALACKLRERCLCPASAYRQGFARLVFDVPSFTALAAPAPSHSPPRVSLRI